MSVIIIGVVVVVLLVIIYVKYFREEIDKSYDQDYYEGKDTTQFPITSKKLSNLIENRDDAKHERIPSAASLAKSLKSDTTKGLDGKDLKVRAEHFGVNRFVNPPSPSFFDFFLDSFEDRTLQILLGSAILSIILGVTVDQEEGGWIEGAAILAAVMLVSTVTALNDYNKEQQFAALSSLDADKKIKVKRNGAVSILSTFDILVGDVVSMEAGDIVPADCVFISGQSVKVDESSLTGETEPLTVDQDHPVLLSGCTIKEGIVTAIVIATGMNSVYGRVKALVQKERSNTPLQDKLEELADFIGWLGVGAAILTWIALVAKWAIYRFVTTDLGWEWSQANVLVEFIITAITIVAMAVPEGLPLAVTISLAYSMMKMMADQNLVRHLVACETMGGATQICSDKTGTLTQNKMTVTNVVLSGGASFDLNQHGPTKVAEFASGLNPELSRLFAQNISVNSSALVLEQNGKKVVSGSASEIALIEFLQKMNVDPAKIRKDEAENILRGFPFSSSKKRMSTLMKAGKKDAILIVKGASEVVLAQCVNDYANGKESALTDAKRAEVTHQIEQWAKRGLRTLTFAYRRIPLPDDVSTLEDGELDEQLTYIGVVGIKDPVRPEVPQAVQDCAKAGIKVRMLTGDNILTAKDIALQCKILTDDGDEERCLEGPVFRKMSDRAVNKILPKLEVMARCSPEDKLRLVKLLRAKGEVVAVTGDGTNDAPQLNEADVGFAMGIAGTEVAKQASDIILLDDNFNSILKAVLWGRNVFLSIKKFIQFQLTVNIAAVFIGLLGAMTTGSTPLKAVQLLWVNLIMDTFAALALATDPPTRRLLDQPPYGRFASLITRKMWVCIIGQAIFQLALLVFLLFADMSKVSMLHVPATLSTHDAEGVRNSLIFNVFVFCQLFNEFNCRKIESEESIFQGLFSNKIFVFIMGFSVTVQVLLIQYGGDFVHCVPLNSAQWLFTLCAASISIPLGALLRGIDLKEYQAPKIDNTERARQGWKYARQVLTQVSVTNAFKATLSESKEGTSASSTASGSPNKIDGEEERPNITKSLKKQKRRGSANITS